MKTETNSDIGICHIVLFPDFFFMFGLLICIDGETEPLRQHYKIEPHNILVTSSSRYKAIIVVASTTNSLT